jgi:hypothetical protein
MSTGNRKLSIDAGASESVADVGSIAHKAAAIDKKAIRIDRGEARRAIIAMIRHTVAAGYTRGSGSSWPAVLTQRAAISPTEAVGQMTARCLAAQWRIRTDCAPWSRLLATAS